MPANQYRGARIAFVTEHEVKQELSVMAKQENRTLSKMVETLLLEALKARKSQQKTA